MKTLTQLFEDSNEVSWNFEHQSVLLHYNEHTPCNDIFQAVCHELGRFYSQYGFKYTSSRPKLEYKLGELTLQVGFLSTRSNTPGVSVMLEIITNIYSKKLAQLDKLEEYNAKGYLLGRPELTYRVHHGKPSGSVTVQLLDGTVTSERIEDRKDAVHIFNQHYNVYGLTPEKFKAIVHYINTRSIEPFINLLNEDYLIEFIKNTATGCFGRETKRFEKFVELNFESPSSILKAIEERVRFYSNG